MGDRERLMNIGKAIKDKRAEVDAVKKERDSVKAENKGNKDKQDKISKAVKALTKAEFDALPKSLQKELKEFRD